VATEVTRSDVERSEGDLACEIDDAARSGSDRAEEVGAGSEWRIRSRSALQDVDDRRLERRPGDASRLVETNDTRPVRQDVAGIAAIPNAR
jgi:hypothetical protein